MARTKPLTIEMNDSIPRNYLVLGAGRTIGPHYDTASLHIYRWDMTSESIGPVKDIASLWSEIFDG